MENRLRKSIETGNGYITRFSTLANAIQYRSTRNSSKTTPIILGNDGKFWLTSTNRAASILQRWGYDTAEEQNA